MNARAVYVAFLVALAGLLVAGPALASDQPPIIYPEDETRTVSPGEMVELRVFVDSDGGFGNVGLARVTMNASFEAEHLEATGVDFGTYLEEGEPTDVHEEATIDNEAGVVVADQWRDPARNGSTGTHRFATVTFEVAEDAPAGNTTVSLANSSAELAGEYEVFVYEHNATFVIEEPASGEQSASSGEPRGDTGDEAAGESTAGEDSGGPIPAVDATAPDVLAATVAVLVVLGVALAARRR